MSQKSLILSLTPEEEIAFSKLPQISKQEQDNIDQLASFFVAAIFEENNKLQSGGKKGIVKSGADD